MNVELTADEERHFRDRLTAIGARLTCPICDSGRWSLGFRTFTYIERICAQCGNILYFDPAAFGWRLGWEFDLHGPGGQHKMIRIYQDDGLTPPYEGDRESTSSSDRRISE